MNEHKGMQHSFQSGLRDAGLRATDEEKQNPDRNENRGGQGCPLGTRERERERERERDPLIYTPFHNSTWLPSTAPG